MQYTHNMEYYPATERNEVLICAAAWLDLRNITLRNQILKTTYSIISFTGNVQNKQIYRDRK